MQLYNFDANKVKFKKVKIKNVSSSNGGLLSIVNEQNEVIKYKIPTVLVTQFKKKYGMSNYIVPVYGCIMKYDDQVISIEKAVTDEIDNFDVDSWLPGMIVNFQKLKQNIDSTWLYDGLYVYKYDDINNCVKTGTSLSNDKKFRSVNCQAYRLSNLGYVSDIQTQTRNCLVYVSNTGEYCITPPIWKQLGGIGNSNLKKSNEQIEEIGLSCQFDKLDEVMGINLNFVLAAGELVSKAFGYRYIEPLQIPKLMLQLKTVNLPLISKEVKSSYSIGMTFTQTLAWLIGLLNKATSFDQMVTIRRLLKYVTTHGSFHKQTFDNLHHDKYDIPLMSVDELMGRL